MKSQLSKIIFVALFTGMVSVFATMSASAQNSYRFETEFDFRIGKDKLDAGKYEFQKLSNTKYLLRNVESKESRLVFFELTARSSGSPEPIRVTFNRYGETYFLHGLYGSPDAAGKIMIRSAEEKRFSKNGANGDGLAKSTAKPEKVSVKVNN